MTPNRSPEEKIYFSIDRGGTFTDIYASQGKKVFSEKLLSSDPANYRDAPSEGIRRILERVTGEPVPPGNIPTRDIGWIRMGTTVATNALLERTGTDCALAVTMGFGDLLRIGYQNRPELFALNIIRPQPIYKQVIEIGERIRPVSEYDRSAGGTIKSGIGGEQFLVLEEPDPDAVRVQLREVYDSGIRSLAVVLMHSYSFPDHERLIGDIAVRIGFRHISLSHEVMPRIRIVGRGDTASIDAYLTPHINDYLENFSAGFQDRLRSTPLFFMQSDGGLVESRTFRGCKAILSGPAGGVVGYAMAASRQLGGKPFIGFDMGGTSTDVSRYDGALELVHETEIAGVRIQVPQLDIRTVAAGGGSRLFYRNSRFIVGPESSGAQPGPVCYRKNGHLAVTDANLFLGRLHPDFFPKIFGPGENLPLDYDAVRTAFEEMCRKINSDPRNPRRSPLSAEEVALGFLEVANEVMVRPIREISVMRGLNIKEHILACFGGAGGQHAAAVARMLGIRTVFLHREAGILSALGLGEADLVIERQEPAGMAPLKEARQRLGERLDGLAVEAEAELAARGYEPCLITVTRYLNLRYEGTDTAFMVPWPEGVSFEEAFSTLHRREFGFDLRSREPLVDDLRIRACAALPSQTIRQAVPREPGRARTLSRCYFKEGWLPTPVYLADDLGAGQRIDGPALIMQSASTILVDPSSRAEVTGHGDIILHLEDMPTLPADTEADPIRLAIFGNRFMSIAEQMGRVLQKTALSTNIKERLDFSCAIFDSDGSLVANAPHVPVHLGAMSDAVREQIRVQGGCLRPGDVLAGNHPGAGGSHLPDITVVSPVWRNGAIRFYVASRGHHSDVGGISPGSMPPFSRTLDDEGLHFKSFKIIDNGMFKEDELRGLLLAPAHPVRHPETVIADLKAQVAANRRGIDLLTALMEETSEEVVLAYMGHIQRNAESTVRTRLMELARDKRDGRQGSVFEAEDYLDDGSKIRLRLEIDLASGSACFDFTGTGYEMWSNLNAPPAVTRSAVMYSLRCLIADDIPLNEGCLQPVTIVLPPDSLLCPSDHAAVAGGNVLTSQRIVDVIFKAVRAAAASQGCMNNLTFGNESFGYYETIGGGAGAGPGWHGCSGVHTHMTNTRITDPEILEQRYPVMLREFSIRRNSGGDGLFCGGDGLVRDIEFLAPLNVTILSERRVFRPYGLNGGQPGKTGQNLFIAGGRRIINLGGRNEIGARPGDRIRILTPGGGGYG